MPPATILRTKFIPGGQRDGALTAPLGDALARQHGNDCHFAAYTSPLRTRLTRAHIGETMITMGALVVDVDAPAHDATPEWRAAEAPKVGLVVARGAAPFVYFTRGGYRLVWALGQPFEISSDDAAAEWSARYLAALDALQRDFQISGDRSCCDWQRLYRLPHATRAAGGVPEALPTIGDPHALGAFELPEVEKAPTLAPGRRPAKTQVLEPATAQPPGERGGLFDLLDPRGDVLRPLRPGVWVVRCPNEAEHTTGRTGDTSTVLYEANGIGAPGMIVCRHASCQALKSARAWRRVMAANAA